MANMGRRTAIVAITGTAGLVAASFIAMADAATTLTQSSITPANGATVQDSRPTITAVYSDNLDSASSTIAVSNGPATYSCPKTVSGKNISCTPSVLLKAATYTVKIHAVDATDKTATADNTSTFIVDVPTLSSESPPSGASVATLPNGVVSATYNEAIDNSHSTITVQQITDGNGVPGNYTPLTGTTAFPGQSSTAPAPAGQPMNDGKTIQFTPDAQPQSSGTYQVSLDVFGVTAGGTLSPNAYNAKAESRDVFQFTIDRTPPVTPTNLKAPVVTQSNQTAVPFTGDGKPGNSITVNASDGTTSVTNGTPIVIATCGDASCPWTVTLDLHTLADTTHGTWVATAHNSVGTASSPTQTLVKDTTGPAAPTVTVSLPSGSATAHVTGTDSDPQTDHYSLVGTDTHGHTTPALVLTKDPNGGVSSNGSYAGDLDVSSLDDGTITVSVTPFDSYGNKGASAGSATATKNVGMAPVFTPSFFALTAGGTTTFPTVQADPNHVVRPFGQVAVEFTNPIALTRNDSGHVSPANINAPKPYFVDNFGSGNTFAGTPSIDSKDNRRLLITPPAHMADGGYTLHVSVFEGNGVCDFDSDPTLIGGQGGAPSCPTFSGFVTVPGSGSNFAFDLITPVNTALTASSSSSRVVYGQSVTLSGHLTRTDTNAGLGGQSLTITPRFDNGATGSPMHVTTTSTGSWSQVLRPAYDARYLVTFTGDLRLQPSSASTVTNVNALVRITRIYARSASHKSPVTISGTVGPNQAGRVVDLYCRKVGASHYQRIAAMRLSSQSTFAFTRTFAAGTYYCYVVFPAQNGNQAGRSGTAHFSRS